MWISRIPDGPSVRFLAQNSTIHSSTPISSSPHDRGVKDDRQLPDGLAPSARVRQRFRQVSGAPSDQGSLQAGVRGASRPSEEQALRGSHHVVLLPGRPHLDPQLPDFGAWPRRARGREVREARTRAAAHGDRSSPGSGDHPHLRQQFHGEDALREPQLHLARAEPVAGEEEVQRQLREAAEGLGGAAQAAGGARDAGGRAS